MVKPFSVLIIANVYFYALEIFRGIILTMIKDNIEVNKIIIK